MKSKFKMLSNLKAFLHCQAARGLKSSRKRLAVINYFIKKDRHYTAEQLYDEIKIIDPLISYSTVYRTMKLLVDCGLARMEHFDGRETRFEPIHEDKHHDHLVCLNCGRIIEFSHNTIEKIQKAVVKKHRFLYQSHKLELYGFCPHCRKSIKKTSTA